MKRFKHNLINNLFAIFVIFGFLTGCGHKTDPIYVPDETNENYIDNQITDSKKN